MMADGSYGPQTSATNLWHMFHHHALLRSGNLQILDRHHTFIRKLSA